MSIKNSLGTDYIEPDVSDDGEKIWIHYPSVIESNKSGYLSTNVLIEFGGRNITEPNQEHLVKPYLADLLQELEFPIANVTVLSPLRTFWEKVTLIHAECHRKEFKANANRLSRHWYDLAALARNDICDLALNDVSLLCDVIRYKKIFYTASHSNYDACLQGEFRLIPNQQFLAELKLDFEGMLNSGMFYGQPPTFEDMMTSIENLEKKLNGMADCFHRTLAGQLVANNGNI